MKIRPIQISDAKDLLSLILNNSSELIDYFSITSSSVYDIESATNYIIGRINALNEKTFYQFVLRINDKLIGVIMLKNFDWKTGKAEGAYYIDKHYYGNGYATSALRFLINFAFNELKLNKIYLRIDPNNIGSIRVAEKNKFEREGTLRKEFCLSDNKLIDLEYYGLLNPNV